MARYYHNNYSYLAHFSFPLHLCFFVLILFFVLGFSWYINYEYMVEDLVTQVKLFLLLCPLILLLVVHFLSAEDRRRVPLIVSLPEKESFHRAGGITVGYRTPPRVSPLHDLTSVFFPRAMVSLGD
ncbi:hypothetical protein NL676_031492 [Syzygium grande]|nr:hypothetical protein NL676_031492 [Syzygium grande]